MLYISNAVQRALYELANQTKLYLYFVSTSFWMLTFS